MWSRCILKIIIFSKDKKVEEYKHPFPKSKQQQQKKKKIKKLNNNSVI